MKTVHLNNVVSGGIAVGRVFVPKRVDLKADTRLISNNEKLDEQARFKAALDGAVAEIELLAQDNEILMAHAEMAQSDTIIDGVFAKIADENKNAQMALSETAVEVEALFLSLDDVYLRQRVDDVRDICKRIMAHLKGVSLDVFSAAEPDSIVVADDLVPSDTAAMDFNKIKGFITRMGGATSHVSIIAKNIGIPAVVGMSDIFDVLKHGDSIILNTQDKLLIIDPSEAELKAAISRKKQLDSLYEEMKAEAHLPAETVDGHRVNLYANAGSVADVKKAMENHACGIGLFRTEFLYMESTGHFPTEDDQFHIYKEIATIADGKPVVIRTLDIGGDKGLPYYQFPKEENPFLGWRAIRVSLDLQDMFKAQLRAILRASVFGKLQIMYPMIISLKELDAANAVLKRCMDELRAEGVSFDERIDVGIMIETPAAVLIAEELAQKSDFFSIGTNDLTQYMLAVDRGNEKIADLYDSFHPAVLRAIKMTIDAGHKYGKPVSMCGEFSGEPKAAPLLLGLGLTKFSMSFGSLGNIKYKIRKINSDEARQLAQKILIKTDTNDIMTALDDFGREYV